MPDDITPLRPSTSWVRRTAWLLPTILLAIYLGWLSVSHPTTHFAEVSDSAITCPALLGDQDTPTLYNGLTATQAQSVEAFWRKHASDSDSAEEQAKAVKAAIIGCDQARQNQQTWIFLVGIATLGSLVISSHYARRQT